MSRIIVDTREQQPLWTAGANVVVRKLDTGDYSLEGFEDVVCIERKKSVAEVATNIVEARFWREIDRMAEFKHKHLVCNFTIDDILRYPKGSGIPKWRWKYLKVKPKFILSSLSKIQMKYDIEVHYCRGTAEMRRVIKDIFSEIH